MAPVKENRVKYPVNGGMRTARCFALAGGPAAAANVTYLPQIDLQVETNDNFNLAPEGDESRWTPRATSPTPRC